MPHRIELVEVRVRPCASVEFGATIPTSPMGNNQLNGVDTVTEVFSEEMEVEHADMVVVRVADPSSWEIDAAPGEAASTRVVIG